MSESSENVVISGPDREMKKGILDRFAVKELRSFGSSVVHGIKKAEGNTGKEWINLMMRDEGMFVALAISGKYVVGARVEIIEEKPISLNDFFSTQKYIPTAKYVYYIRPYNSDKTGKNLDEKGDKAWFVERGEYNTLTSEEDSE